MSFQTTDFLAGLFDGRPSAGPEPAAPAALGPDTSAPVTLRAELTPDGLRLVCSTPEIAAAIEGARPALEALLANLAGEQEAEALEPVEVGEPCPGCGSLEKWWGLTGGEHCQRCEARKLALSLELADRAGRLRRNRPTAKPASPAAPCCDPAAALDSLHVDGERPAAASVGALAGCEARQGLAATCGEK